MTRNRLADSISPYLIQHADNPVDWYAWGPEALERARDEDRPILLSIGYAACHWCHVMAHESFEDRETAALMNRIFINVKVDREERPDLDRIYQFSHIALTGRGGGWPLTVVLDPRDLQAFFAGTYFPRRPARGAPAFVDVLQRLGALWRERREEIHEQSARLAHLFEELDRQLTPAAPTAGPLAVAREELKAAFDSVHGGFGDAPKFPQPGVLALALHARGNDAATVADLARTTLEHMADGGIHDQVGGGFARYSVDAAWQIPHFEKMLCDNALLLSLYAEAAARFERADFARVALDIATWARREMTAPGGGYCASLDADSEGEEGRFYVWDREEVRALLDDDSLHLAERHYGLDRPPNFEGRWHPVVAVSVDTLAAESGVEPGEIRRRLDEARAILYAARARRVPPARDDKVLTAWNAMMIEGLATAGQRLAEPALVDEAVAALDFLRRTCWLAGQLFAVHREGTTRQPAFLEDHATLVSALLAVLRARWRVEDVVFARGVADALLARFHDDRTGGFHQTPHDHEPLPWRPKPLADDALPSPNGIAAIALWRLGHLLGETRYIEAAESTVALAMAAVARQPLGHSTLIRALADQIDPPEQVILHGDAAALAPLAAQAGRRFAPDRLVFAVPTGAAPDSLPLPRSSGEAVALCCRGSTCDAPVHGAEAIRDRLDLHGLPFVGSGSGTPCA